MRYVMFRNSAGAAEPGAVIDGNVISLADAGFTDLLGIISGGMDARARVDHCIFKASGSAVHQLADVRLLAPIARPPKLICVGLNYRDHALESKMPIPEVPTIFSKFSTAVIGPGDPIVLPKSSSRPDYEAEFAFVISRGGRHIAAEDWREHVFGYTIMNDVSARDYQMATTQWLMGKTFDTFAPMGPYLVSAEEIPDPHSLGISLTLNGETMQSSSTHHLIFGVPELVAFLSSVFTLEPGDIVSTGTPAGVGFARKPPRYLCPGDEVVVRVDGMGELRNPVVAEA